VANQVVSQPAPLLPAAADCLGSVSGGTGAVKPRKVLAPLDNDAALIPAVPNRWAPSRHHVAELLHGVGCVTAGDFRRFIHEIEFGKIVDAMFAADAACTAPGGVRNLEETRKCLEDLARLVGKSHLSSSGGAQAVTATAAAMSTCKHVETSPGLTGDVSRGQAIPDRARCHQQHPQVESSATVHSEDAAFKSEVQRVPPPLPTRSSTRQQPPPGGSTSVEELPLNTGQPGSQLPFETADATEEPQLPCPHCGRTFREKVLNRHVGVCLKVNRERSAFNAVAHAIPQEAVKAKEHSEKQVSRKAPRDAGKGAGWKAKSEAFRAAIKGARVVDEFIKQGRPLSELPPPKATAPELDDRVQCPHCGRRFGQQQAERHIPICPKAKGRKR